MKKISRLISISVFLTSVSSYAQKKEVGEEFLPGVSFGGTIDATLKKHNGYKKSALEFIAQIQKS